MKKILITTAIDYTNDVIHIGHAYQKIVADCLARFYRILGYQVFFLTGTDEYGITNQQAAEKAKKTPKEYVDEIAKNDQQQLRFLNIAYDRFIRTTDLDHQKTVTEFYLRVFKNGDIYKAKYQGYYCEGCESYKTLSELNEKGQCPLHLTRPIKKIEEENYFFRWSKYQDFLKKHLQTHPDFIIPSQFMAEMIAFLNKGLTDIPISRPKFKVYWGIPVPNDSSQTIYVWFDALVNYYTAASKNGFWNKNTKIIHILGKDNLRWHALFWPAMLKSAGLRLPDVILTHGFITLNGKKISKSLGNIIRPKELVEKFGSDGVRYFFLRYGPFNDDVDISLEKIKKVYNSDLANDWGNLILRVLKLMEKKGIDFSSDFKKEPVNFSSSVAFYLKNFQIPQALEEIFQRIKRLNQFINEKKPWEKKKKEAEKILKPLSQEICQIAFDLQPFMPESSGKIFEQFIFKSSPTLTVYFPRIK